MTSKAFRAAFSCSIHPW